MVRQSDEMKLLNYLLGEMSSPDEKRLMEDLKQDPQLRMALEELRGTLVISQKAVTISPSKFGVKRHPQITRRRPLDFIVAIMVAAVGIVGGILVATSGPESKTIGHVATTISTDSPPKMRSRHVTVRIITNEVSVSVMSERAYILKVLQEHSRDLKVCGVLPPDIDPNDFDVPEKMILQWTLDSEGNIVSSSTTGGATDGIAKCYLEKLKALRFPPLPKEDQKLTVVLPVLMEGSRQK